MDLEGSQIYGILRISDLSNNINLKFNEYRPILVSGIKDINNI